MDGRVKRTQKIIQQIKETALELFSSNEVKKVSMDEIAQRANVSKVTIYKHFHSKEMLLNEVIKLWSDKVFTATEHLLNSDLDFLEKLRLIMVPQVDRPQMASDSYLFELLEKDEQQINERLKRIMIKFFEEGKRQGYIDENLPLEVLYLYSEIYRTGYRARLTDVEAIVVNKEIGEQMNNLFFFGIINRK